MARRSTAVMVGVHDGWYGCGTGAGHSNRRLLETLDGLLPPDVDLVVVPVEVDSGSPNADADWHAGVRAALARRGRTVRVFPVANGTGGARRFGGMDAFAALTASTSACVQSVREQYEQGLLLLADVPFLGAAAGVAPRAGWETVVLPRSSAALHCTGNPARARWERQMLCRAATRGAWVAAISAFMRAHLRDLGVPGSAIVDCRNGLVEEDRRFTPGPAPDGVAQAQLAGRDGFVYALGRAVPRKGFGDLLDAWTLLRDRGEELPPLVLAAVSEQPEPTAHQRWLASVIAERRLPVTLLTTFGPEARGLLAHDGVRAVVVPSRVEPFGRIPLEAYAAGAVPVVATRAGGLAELVHDGVTGFSAAPADASSLATAIQSALRVDEPDRARMRAAADGVLRMYDYRANIVAFLTHVAPWSLDPAMSSTLSSATSSATPSTLQATVSSTLQAPARSAPFPDRSRASTTVPGRPGLAVLQVPEACGWNPYVAGAETALGGRGITVVRPGLCADDPEPGSQPEVCDLRRLTELRADVVHLHWPEKLAARYGIPAALWLLRNLRSQGAVIVQTVHNLAPHEPSAQLRAYGRAVDALTDGIHVFSPAHEQAARANRPELPGPVLHLPHPRYPDPPLAEHVQTTPPQESPGRHHAWSMGCFGRLRGYKRTAGFAEAFLRGAPGHARLLVAGQPADTVTGQRLAALAAADPRLDYRPGFIGDHHTWQTLVASVGWVALPYARLYSSGVLVTALQAGRAILSPTPTGGTHLYLRTDTAPNAEGDARPAWLTVDPWDHDAAIDVWARHTARPTAARPTAESPLTVSSPALALPDWPDAADRLARFYHELRRRTEQRRLPAAS